MITILVLVFYGIWLYNINKANKKHAERVLLFFVSFAFWKAASTRRMSLGLCTSFAIQLQRMVSVYLKSGLCVFSIVRLHASNTSSKGSGYSSVHFLINTISAGAGFLPLIPNAFKIEKQFLRGSCFAWFLLFPSFLGYLILI